MTVVVHDKYNNTNHHYHHHRHRLKALPTYHNEGPGHTQRGGGCRNGSPGPHGSHQSGHQSPQGRGQTHTV